MVFEVWTLLTTGSVTFYERVWDGTIVKIPERQHVRSGGVRSVMVAAWPHKNDKTHVEDVKDPVELQLPGGNLLLIVPCAEEPPDRVPFTPFGYVLLNLFQNPVI